MTVNFADIVEVLIHEHEQDHVIICTRLECATVNARKMNVYMLAS
jgi:hypothetical protein